MTTWVPVRRTAAALGLVMLAAGLSTGSASAAENPAPVRVTAKAPVARATVVANARIRKVLPLRVKGSKVLAKSKRSVVVTDVVTGAGLYSSNIYAPLRGASVTKLATAVTSLSLFGTTTRFPTTVVTGRSNREVVLVAGGDPLLTSAQLRTLAYNTAASLVATLPPVTPPVVPPVPAPTDTSSPVPTPPAPTPPVPVVPPAPPTPVAFSVRVDDSRFPAPTRATGWTTDYVPWVVTPVRPLQRDLRNGTDTTVDAAAYFTTQLHARLRALLAARADLTVSASYRGRLVAPVGATELARFVGNTTGAILSWMLLVSDNDVAEMMYRNNALAVTGRATWAAGKSAVTRRLAALGVNVRGWQLYDGSGVSRSDRLTGIGLITLLRAAQSPAHPELHPLLSMLPVAGRTGTLAPRNGRFTAKPSVCARGRIFAKTGTLHDTIGLAGYARGTDGQLKAFAVLVNDPSTRYSKLTVRRTVDAIAATATGCY